MTDALPVGSRVVHIGPPKTGTTTLQGALDRQRAELERHGVHYAGKSRQAWLAASAVVHGRPPEGFAASTMRRWPQLVKEVRSSTAPRVLVSAELFAAAGDDAICRVVDAFGPQTEIVITVRPLARLLPSQWQQFVQSGLQTPYDDWLQKVLSDRPVDPSARRFWRRHRHDRLARRWARVVGRDHVTVVVLRDGDHDMNLRVFERLLALPEGLLVADEQTNRSFTLAEIEMLREVNRQFADTGLPRASYEKYVRYGLDAHLKRRVPAVDEVRIVTPLWALDRVDGIATRIGARLARSGVRVVGDLEWLRLPVPDSAPHDVARTDVAPLDAAACAIVGAIQATVGEPKNLGVPRTRELAGALRSDARAALRRVRRR